MLAATAVSLILIADTASAVTLSAQDLSAPRTAVVSRAAIDAAVRETRPASAEPDQQDKADKGPILSAKAADKFAEQFEAARLPDCLHKDGLKHQPTFLLGGVLALPFILVAKARGVCD